MATITKTEWHPHLGSIWQRLIGLWEGYIEDVTVTWATSFTAVSSCFCLQVTLTGATDTNVWKLVDGGRGSTDYMPPTYINNLPGWRTTPKVMTQGVTPRHKPTLFQSQLVVLRGNLWVEYDNGNTVSYTQFITNLSNLGPMRAYTHFAVARYRNQIVPDVISIITGDQTADEYLYNTRPITEDVQTDSLTVNGGGGGSVDLTGLVSAVEDLAMVDYNTTINNGSQMWSMRGRVRVG